jgi:hypothetical protein
VELATGKVAKKRLKTDGYFDRDQIDKAFASRENPQPQLLFSSSTTDYPRILPSLFDRLTHRGPIGGTK